MVKEPDASATIDELVDIYSRTARSVIASSRDTEEVQKVFDRITNTAKESVRANLKKVCPPGLVDPSDSEDCQLANPETTKELEALEETFRYELADLESLKQEISQEMETRRQDTYAELIRKSDFDHGVPETRTAKVREAEHESTLTFLGDMEMLLTVDTDAAKNEIKTFDHEQQVEQSLETKVSKRPSDTSFFSVES